MEEKGGIFVGMDIGAPVPHIFPLSFTLRDGTGREEIRKKILEGSHQSI